MDCLSILELLTAPALFGFVCIMGFLFKVKKHMDDDDKGDK